MVVIAALCGCHKDAAPLAEPHAPASTAELDALWAKEPAGATIGVVVSPRGLTMLEHAWHDVHGFLKSSPAFAPVEQEMASALADEKLTTDLTLASLGLAPGKGFAFFLDAHQHGVALLPVVDRDRFLAVMHGTKGPDSDRIEDAMCKPLDGWYACADGPGMLNTLGKGELRKELAAVGARGDIEAVVTAPAKGAAVVQLARGSLVVRGVVDGVPSAFIQKLGAPVHPRVDLDHTSGFAVINLAPLVADLPRVPLIDGVTAADLGASVAGPLTITATPGGAIDVRIPLKDTAPAAKLLAHCTDLPPLAALGATLVHGACHARLPLPIPLALDARIDGHDLRVTADVGQAATAAAVPVSAVAKELAGGAWQVAFWGRGTLIAVQQPALPAIAIPPDAELAVGAIAMLNEVGLGVTNDGDRLRVVAEVRTGWANPDDVIAKLEAVSAADLRAGKGPALCKAIAEASPHAPFATDYHAGPSGLLVPSFVGGAVGFAAVQMFTEYAGQEDSVELTKLAVTKYAFEAFPEWASAHPDQECPTSLAELDEYVSNPPPTDPWGHAYQMACGANLPPGAKGLAVWSVGPDGQTGTADDITSWK